MNAPNAGIIFFTLEPFEERRKEEYGLNIAGALNGKFASIQDAFVAVFPPPPVNGLGVVGGFKMQLEDRAGLGETALDEATQALIGQGLSDAGARRPLHQLPDQRAAALRDVDREKVKQEGVSLTDVFQTLQIYLGSVYVNDFNRFGRTYQVIAQADAPFRATAENITQLKVRNAEGDMVPLGSVLQVKESHGPDWPALQRLSRGRHQRRPGAGLQFGPGVAAMERLASEVLPNGIGFEWTDLTYQQQLAGNTAVFVFPLCVLLVFLVLAAQYESWSLPLAIILIVPMCLFCAIAGVWLTKGTTTSSPRSASSCSSAWPARTRS